MPSAVIPIRAPAFEGSASEGDAHYAFWALLEVAPAGCVPQPVGVIVVDGETGHIEVRMRESTELVDLELDEDEAEVLDAVAADLVARAKEDGAMELLDSLEDSLSNFLRVSDRERIALSRGLSATAEELYAEHVDPEVRPFVTHLPLYSLQAAATRFGEQMDVDEDSDSLDWIRIAGTARRSLTKDMFVAQVVGRSMEPLIPDGSFCIFRAATAGSRQGKRLLIEQFTELDRASRYTVKRYTSAKRVNPETGEWEHERIRLEPLNPEFEAFDLGPEDFRVVAEFIEALST